MSATPQQQLRAYVDYLRDLGIYDLYRRDEGRAILPEALRAEILSGATASRAGVAAVLKAPMAARPVLSSSPAERSVAQRPAASVSRLPLPPQPHSIETELPPELAAPMPKPVSFNQLVPLPAESVPANARAAALETLRTEIGDCTRCPLAYAGRRKIVFADGDANAQLMFIGEGPGADEDESGVPFVGKAGQLLNNMIVAMGVKREDVYIANIVKCRPPGNRAPEPVEANTCSQFLIRQIDIVRPKVIVALGATAATYLLGVRQSLGSLRGTWHESRGAKVAVTYHPAFLLRDPRQKGEAWKDLQMVMKELGLKPPAKPTA